MRRLNVLLHAGVTCFMLVKAGLAGVREKKGTFTGIPDRSIRTSENWSDISVHKVRTSHRTLNGTKDGTAVGFFWPPRLSLKCPDNSFGQNA
jgi:hypothetical protein